MKRFLFWKREEEPRRAARGSPGDESSLLTGDPAEDARSLEILLETIAAVTVNIDLDGVLRDVVDRSLQVTNAERAILFLGDAPDALVVRIAQDKDGAAIGRSPQ